MLLRRAEEEEVVAEVKLLSVFCCFACLLGGKGNECSQKQPPTVLSWYSEIEVGVIVTKARL